MDDMMKGVLYIFYSLSSFFFITFLWNCCFSKLAKSTFFSRWKAYIELKFFAVQIFQYSTCGLIVITGCAFYILYFIIYQKQLYSTFELGSFPLLSLILNFCKMVKGYSSAEINMSLNDDINIGVHWAHQAYDAYYKIVLESMIDRMTDFEKEHDIQLLCKKLLVIIPLSCDAEGTLNNKDEAIKEFGLLAIVENDQGANVNREYTNKVHKISSSRDTYIVAELSSPVSTLFKSKFEMKKENILYIRDCYIKTLKMLVLGSPCIVIEYNDAVNGHEPLSQCILSTVQKESSIIV